VKITKVIAKLWIDVLRFEFMSIVVLNLKKSCCWYVWVLN